ncbi:MAG: translation initiation factor IF-3 [Candidatus Viridilinea halotolerans]|uniref:Translation initiation factor IF-3 n=1 Tax=Candidatus Viridilinea halotolerans TaxID=2491704 RepID=A0A426TZP1_9CHLR|nr:MAG: translation initiation factor IF-3 [Candidatus Viridilinea halotolerans]
MRDRFRINNRIRAREVRLIDDQGTQVGIVGVREAIQMAEERGFDLVEVAPNAVPPVCRLLDYGKFRYEQSKKEREARKNQKQAELKQIRLMPKTDDHDIAVKANQAKRFLLQGDKVKFNVRFRGREMAHPEIGRKMLEAIAEQLREIAIVEQRPLMEGRVLSLLVAPTPKVLKAAQQAQKARLAQKASAGTHEESAHPAATEQDDAELDDDELDDDDDELDDDDDELDDDDDDEDEDLEDDDLAAEDDASGKAK